MREGMVENAIHTDEQELGSGTGMKSLTEGDNENDNGTTVSSAPLLAPRAVTAMFAGRRCALIAIFRRMLRFFVERRLL